ncbi:YtxH domain-containing protein [Pedobacter sp.]|uniref:YtxH domain-containing protein n=1 Tax=Pedobacter sp. TaxID=1411316 RepID=UPI0031DAD5D5
MTKQTKILSGVLAGVALGAVVAMVLSSDKHSGMKSKINDWFCDLFDKSKDKLAGVAEMVKDKADKMKA